MEIHNSYIGMKRFYPKLIVALGNFDGVHQGHRELLTRLVNTAREENAVPAVFTFDPHPMQVINPESTPPMLLTREDKIEMIARLGVGVLFCIPFTEAFGQMSPESFISDVLVQELAVKGILVGYNYNFGREGRGNTDMLAASAGEYGYKLTVLPPVIIDGQPVSSTFIRGLMLEGKVEEASNYLGYLPFIKGRVVNGEKRGRTIGFPTANLDLPKDLLVPETGVYAVQAHCAGQILQGVANIGYKPTFQREMPRKNLEVHILDFAQDIYGQEIKVEFLKRIRAEVKFNSPEDLIKQIQTDKSQAGIFFKENIAKPD